MRNFTEDLVSSLISLYDMYEMYLWRHENSKLDILLQDRLICFYVYNEKEDIDNIIVTFADKDYQLYNYICVGLLIRLISDCVMKIDDNVIFSDVHKPYFKLIVNDDNLNSIMRELIDRQLKEIVNIDTDKVQQMKRMIKWRLFYPKKFMNNLDERVQFSKKLLRSRG